MQDLSLSGRDAATTGLRRLIRNLAPATREPQNAEFLRALAILGGALFVLTLVSYLLTTNWTGAFPRDKATLVLGRDFLNLWMYGVAAFEADPARYYDLVTYNDALAHMLGPGYPGQNWPNPPTALVVMAPFGLLNYFPALFAWFSVSGLAFYLAGRREVSDWRTLAIVLVSPAALMCVLSGQSSLLTTAALLAIFASLDKRPIAAGVLIGLLTVKPQLGILFPFALIASGRWKVFSAAAATALALLAASVAIGGIEGWQDYITKALPLQREVLQDAAGTAMPFQPSIFMNIRGVVGNHIGEIIQFAFTLAAVAAVAAAFRWRRERRSAHAAGAVLRLHGVGLALYGRLRSVAADLRRGRADRRGEARRHRTAAGAARVLDAGAATAVRQSAIARPRLHRAAVCALSAANAVQAASVAVPAE